MELPQLETLIQARETGRALPELKRLEKKTKRNPELLAWVCDAYRRLGHFEKGFKLVGPSTAIKRTEPADSMAGIRLLWAARFLNLLGASPYARQLAERVEPVSWRDHRILGNIWLSNFENVRALALFEKMIKLCPAQERETYAARLSLIDWADALNSTGRTEAALEVAADVAKKSSEAYAQAVAIQAQGEYLARAARFAEAQPLLQKAATLFPPGDETVDRAFLLKWQGYVAGKLGDLDHARKCFTQALAILQVSTQRAEAWLDVHRLRHELGLLTPQESSNLARYPGIAPGFRERLLPVPTQPSKTNFLIDFHRQEWREEGQLHWGLDLEIKLLGFLVAAQPWGMSPEPLKALLWPNDLYAYGQLGERLRKLTARLEKRFGVKVQPQNGFLRAPVSDIGVNTGTGQGRPSFLENRTDFDPQTMGDAYALKRTQRAAVLQAWLKAGWITREGSRSRPTYRVVLE